MATDQGLMPRSLTFACWTHEKFGKVSCYLEDGHEICSCCTEELRYCKCERVFKEEQTT